jgi:hypothetical protein
MRVILGKLLGISVVGAEIFICKGGEREIVSGGESENQETRGLSLLGNCRGNMETRGLSLLSELLLFGSYCFSKRREQGRPSTRVPVPLSL